VDQYHQLHPVDLADPVVQCFRLFHLFLLDPVVLEDQCYLEHLVVLAVLVDQYRLEDLVDQCYLEHLVDPEDLEDQQHLVVLVDQ